MNEELESFVENEEVETVETTAESQVSGETEDTVVETDTSSEVETKSEPTTPTTETMIPLAAKQAEKERRKVAEDRARTAELEVARLQGMQQAQVKPEQVEVPDPYTQPEEYTQHVINQQNTKIANDQNNALKVRLQAAEDVARVELDQYDKFAEHFAKVVAPQNPNMVEMMKASPDPAKYAYYKGKQAFDDAEIQSQISQAGGLDGYKAQLKAEIEAELAVKPAPTIPLNLNSVNNSGGEPAANEISEGTDGLNQLLGR